MAAGVGELLQLSLAGGIKAAAGAPQLCGLPHLLAGEIVLATVEQVFRQAEALLSR
jgi:hypothetical protein